MRVSDLAKELGISSDAVLNKLRTLKLKAKDAKQELNSVVETVLRRELAGSLKALQVQNKESAPAKTGAKAALAKDEKPKTKIAAKAAEKPKAAEKTKAVKAAKGKTKAASGQEKEKSQKIAGKPSQASFKKTEADAKKIEKVEKPKDSLSAKELESLSAAPIKAPVSPIIKEAPKARVEPSSPTLAPTAITLAKPVERSAFAQPARPFGFQTRPSHFSPRQQTVQPKFEPLKIPTGELEIQFPVAVKDLSVHLQQKPSVILKVLMEKGIMATINQNLGEDIVQELSKALGFTFIKSKTKEEQLVATHALETEDKSLLKPRPPVVTFMGHVDHGKTSLLDKIRKAKVADQEHGGITQHIGAYSVVLPRGKITFLDTPGHEAFTAMRARGAYITDLVVLVVAADEGIMPQTEEAIDHARAANVPIIVALNKIDKRGADIDKVKKQLSEKGLMPEDWGGKTIVAGVSAMTGEGIDHLLEMIILEAELLELKANYERKASGIVVEAKLSHGRGPIATMIVQNGTLYEGSMVVAGPYFGKIKAMLDDHARPVKEAGPATAVEILGLSGIPEAGEKFYVIEDERQARDIILGRQALAKAQKLQPLQKITLEDLSLQVKEGKIRELNIIIKSDVQGSMEALKDSLAKITSTEVQLKFIHTGIGEINTSDVILAEASNAIIIGFNVNVDARAKEEVEKYQVDVRTYRIIYDAIRDIKNALEGLLEPKTKKKVVGRVEIRQVLKLSKSGIVAGCFVAKGKVHRKVTVDLVRNGAIVFTGTIGSLKRFKDDVRDVAEGFECGITLNGFDAIEAGDVLEIFELEKIARTL